MNREQLVKYLDELLQPAKFRDYCPNGLQVEGRAEVARIVAGVTAAADIAGTAARAGRGEGQAGEQKESREARLRLTVVHVLEEGLGDHRLHTV